MAASTGYSGTPLARKLGFTAEMTVLTVGAPAEYQQWLAPLPDEVRFVARQAKPRAAHLFLTSRRELQRRLVTLRASLVPDGFVWISWPKRSAGVATDITEDVIRAEALPLGFVDIKVCAVSEVWSGLKLVIRRSERAR